MNIDESKVPTAAKGSIEAGYGPKHRGDSLAAADLGVTLSPEQDEVPPLVAIGPAGYTTNEKGEPVEMPMPGDGETVYGYKWSALYAGMSKEEQAGFRRGILFCTSNLSGLPIFHKLHKAFHWCRECVGRKF